MVTCDEDDEEEDILAEIGSEHEEEEYEEHAEGDEILYLDDHRITMNVATRSQEEMQLVFFPVSLRSVSYNSGHAAIQVALVWEEEGRGGRGCHDKLCKLFWRVTIFCTWNGEGLLKTGRPK